MNILEDIWAIISSLSIVDYILYFGIITLICLSLLLDRFFLYLNICRLFMIYHFFVKILNNKSESIKICTNFILSIWLYVNVGLLQPLEHSNFYNRVGTK